MQLLSFTQHFGYLKSWKLTQRTHKNKPIMESNQRNEMIGCVVDIVGIAVGDRGCSCEEHVAFCGVVLGPDVLVRLAEEEILVEEKKDRGLCLFLIAKNADKVNGLLAQVTEVFVFGV